MLLAIGSVFFPAQTSDGPRSAALLAAMVIGVGHMQVDWLWETPATGLLAMSICGLALAGLRRPERPVIAAAAQTQPRARDRRRRRRHPARAAVGAVHRRELPRGAGRRDHAGRARRLLNPFAAAPELARAAAAQRARQPDTQVEALRSATEREPKNWATWALLGEAEAATGDTAAGLRSCLEAQHIKPTVVCPGQSS